MTFKVFILGAMVAAACAGASAVAAPAPSFDCRRASTGVEKAICASDALAAQDASIARHVAQAKQTFDAGTARALTEDQRRFLRIRDVEFAEAADPAARTAGLANSLKYRDLFLATLSYKPREGFEGNWNNLNGGISVERQPHGRLTFTGQTAHPQDGRWLCSVSGVATQQGDTLVVTPDEDDAEGWTLALTRNGDSVTVAERPPATGKAGYGVPFCGMNGTLGGVFFPVSQP